MLEPYSITSIRNLCHLAREAKSTQEQTEFLDFLVAASLAAGLNRTYLESVKIILNKEKSPSRRYTLDTIL